MKTLIEQNNSETITIVTHKDRLAINQEFKGYLPDEINRYKVIVLNRSEARRLWFVLNKWLNNLD